MDKNLRTSERLRQIREDNHKTQKEVAAALNMTQQAYSLYETGGSTLNEYILKDLSALYKISIDDILGNKEHLYSDSDDTDTESLPIANINTQALLHKFQKLNTIDKVTIINNIEFLLSRYDKRK